MTQAAQSTCEGANDTKRALQARERREQLLDVALELFSRKGTEVATIKDLAAAAGVAQGLIYYYFTSKEELLRALLVERSFFPEILEVLACPPDRPAVEALPELARGVTDLFQAKRQLVRVILHQALTHPSVSEGLLRIQREGVRTLGCYLAARSAAGELRPHDAEAAARSIFYTIVMATLFDTAPDALVATFVANLLDGLRRPLG